MDATFVRVYAFGLSDLLKAMLAYALNNNTKKLTVSLGASFHGHTHTSSNMYIHAVTTLPFIISELFWCIKSSKRNSNNHGHYSSRYNM